MLKLASAVTAVASVLVTLTAAAFAQKAPPAVPLVVVCWNAPTKTWVVGNLSTIKEDGTATYMGTSGRLAATVSAKGLVEMPSNRPGQLDCYGKTLDELRAMGRIVDFQRAR